MNECIKRLKIKADLNYNAKTFSIDTSEAKEVLDYIRRLENLNGAYELLIDKYEFGVNCNDCPFIDGCIYNGENVEDCRLKMAKRTNSLGVSI